MKPRLLSFDSDRIVFAAQTRDGVPHVSKEVYAWIRTFCETHNKTITYMEGNFEYTKFFLKEELTDDEVDKFMDLYC